ncbi:hypothetical protein [Streptomonospora alba]|uniref:hypothetical protein n=1 Tax=Streptomonospora alba TaxID=183763 RepID=UPI0012EDDE97|nr:hypothetical protein [Streptomonospora alba]
MDHEPIRKNMRLRFHSFSIGDNYIAGGRSAGGRLSSRRYVRAGVGRTRILVWLAASGVRKGEIVVLQCFRDPHRGWVPCPAAPLVAAHADGRGREVRTYELDMAPEAGEDATVCAASYIDPRTGLPVGVAIGARSDDAGAMAIARDVTESWMAVMRSRRLLLCDRSCGSGCARIDSSDVVFVLGDAPAAEACGIAVRPEHPRAAVHVVDDRMVVAPEWLAGRRDVGVVLGENVRPTLVRTLLSALDGVGPVVVDHCVPRAGGAGVQAPTSVDARGDARHRVPVSGRQSAVARASSPRATS